MPSLESIVAHGRAVETHRPWPRVAITPELWTAAADELSSGCATLLGLWGESVAGYAVHMALIDEKSRDIAVLSLACPELEFPSVGRVHAPAIRLERALHSLYGLRPIGIPDPRPWLDLGFWDIRFPLGARSAPVPQTYAFLPVEGENLHQIPVGPVHAGIIEPGHFRFTAAGETVARLEERLGYVHKGIESLMAGATLERGSRLAARTSGDSTVAYGIAFARAVEAALDIEPPPRAHFLRALMAELERLANHFGDIGAICNDASFALMHAHCGILRELVLRAAQTVSVTG
jgi:Ni,Fe-hydrogenase III component G